MENEGLNRLIRDKKTVCSAIYGFFLDDWDTTHSVIEDLKGLSLLPLLMNSKRFHSESMLVKLFVDKANSCKYLPKQGRLGNIQYLNQVLDLIGFKANFKGQVRTEDGGRRREYTIEDNLCYEVGEGKGKEKIMLHPLLQKCLDKKSVELFEKYDAEYFEKQKEVFLGEEAEKKPLFIREPIDEGEDAEDIENVVDTPIDATPEKPCLSVVSKEVITGDMAPGIGTDKVNQIMTYFFNGVKSGMSILDQIASSIECFGRETFEQACYANSLLLGKCIDVDYKFIEV